MEGGAGQPEVRKNGSCGNSEGLSSRGSWAYPLGPCLEITQFYPSLVPEWFYSKVQSYLIWNVQIWSCSMGHLYSQGAQWVAHTWHCGNFCQLTDTPRGIYHSPSLGFMQTHTWPFFIFIQRWPWTTGQLLKHSAPPWGGGGVPQSHHQLLHIEMSSWVHSHLSLGSPRDVDFYWSFAVSLLIVYSLWTKC